MVTFFHCMDVLYIVLIIKACRIRTKPWWLNKCFQGTETFYFEQIIGDIPGKVIPIYPQVIPIWCWSCPDLSLQQYHSCNSWQMKTSRYLSLFWTENVLCQRCFALFLVGDLQVWIRSETSNLIGLDHQIHIAGGHILL